MANDEIIEPIYDHPAISESYFFPRPGGRLPASDTDGPLDLNLADGTRVGAYACHRVAGAPTLLYLHGNGEIIDDQLEHWPEWAAGAGANAMFVDYPGYATSGGAPSFSSCRQAARAALAHLLGQPRESVPAVIVAGRSVGSIFALDAAAAHASEPRLAGLLLESGVADLNQRLAERLPYERLGIDRTTLAAAVARDFDHRAKLAALGCPVMVLHTVDDSLVPCWHGERLAEWAGARLFRFVAFETGDHNDIQWVNATAYRRNLQDFIAACNPHHTAAPVLDSDRRRK